MTNTHQNATRILQVTSHGPDVPLLLLDFTDTAAAKTWNEIASGNPYSSIVEVPTPTIQAHPRHPKILVHVWAGTPENVHAHEHCFSIEVCADCQADILFVLTQHQQIAITNAPHATKTFIMLHLPEGQVARAATDAIILADDVLTQPNTTNPRQHADWNNDGETTDPSSPQALRYAADNADWLEALNERYEQLIEPVPVADADQRLEALTDAIIRVMNGDSELETSANTFYTNDTAKRIAKVFMSAVGLVDSHEWLAGEPPAPTT